MATHLAALSPAQGQPFEVRARPTPKPGPGELLIAVKAVALNPADVLMRDRGLFIPSYPTVIGFDIAGLVLEIGPNVPTGAINGGMGPSFQPGVTHVAAYSGSFWKSYNPDYGAFQERCLIPWQHAAPLPDEKMPWNQAATLPVAAQVPLSAWDTLQIPRPRLSGQVSSFNSTSPASIVAGAGAAGGIHKDQKQEALLIWGASSSVGTMGVQSARLLRDEPDSTFGAVYATAGPGNKAYVGSLGADRVFNYKDPQVVDDIISAARQDGLVIRHCFLAMGQLAPCQSVLKAFGVGGDSTENKAKIASAPIVPQDAEVVEGVETVFLQPSGQEEERLEQFAYWMGAWLRENLAKGTIRPSPEPMVVGKGLQAVNAGIDTLAQGVSCTKLVIELD